MKAIIDTSSLLALVRYYLPFDQNGKLKNAVHDLFEGNEIVVVDKVVNECRYQAKGIILKELDFIKPKAKFIIKTDEILPSTKFFNRLENDFCNKRIRTDREINDAEFEVRKTAYLNDADAKMILYAMDIKRNSPVVVTEETNVENDGKLFKKIPSICSLAEIDCCTLPSLLKDHCCLNISELFK